MDYTLESLEAAYKILHDAEMRYYREGGPSASYVACFLCAAQSHVRKITAEFMQA